MDIYKKLISIKERKHLCKIYLEKDSVNVTIDSYILAVSKEFVYLREVTDFIIGGYKIVAISSIKNIRYGKYELSFSRILKLEGLIEAIYKHNKMPLDSYMNVFKEIKLKESYCIIESVYNRELDFCIGEIKRVNTKSISMLYFDATGKLDKTPYLIPYDEILNIEFDSTYINTFKKYLKK